MYILSYTIHIICISGSDTYRFFWQLQPDNKFPADQVISSSARSNLRLRALRQPSKSLHPVINMNLLLLCSLTAFLFANMETCYAKRPPCPTYTVQVVTETSTLEENLGTVVADFAALLGTTNNGQNPGPLSSGYRLVR